MLARAEVSADAAARPSGAESASIEVAMRKLSDGLAAGFSRLPGSGRYRRLAVLAFSEVGEKVQRQKLGLIVTAEVATNLKRDHGLFLVERARLGEVLSEMRLQNAIDNPLALAAWAVIPVTATAMPAPRPNISQNSAAPRSPLPP